MPQFSYKDNGEIEFHSKYSIRGVSTMVDVFPNNKKTSSYLKLRDKQDLRSVYNVANKAAVVKRVFFDFLLIMFNELANGGMLVFPGKTGANIALKWMPEHTVKRLSRENKLTEIDILKSNFKVPYFKFDFGPKYARKDRNIKIPKELWRKTFRNAEKRTIKYTYYRKML